VRRWFDKKQEAAASPGSAGLTGPRVPRHSGAWSVLRKRLQSEPGLCIIDTGYTSPANINYLTGLGHSVFLADLVVDAYTGDWRAGNDEDGKPLWNVAGFLDHSLNFSTRADSGAIGCAAVCGHESRRPGAGLLPHAHAG